MPACRERQKPFRIQPFIERQRYDLAQKLSTRLTRFLPSMRKAGGSITPDDDKKLIELLRSRDALRTRLELRDGTALDVWNIAWGYDHGDDFAHITSNISPEQDGSSIDFFFTHQVKKVIDPESGAEIIEFS